jgi:FkbM family methyltransferase
VETRRIKTRIHEAFHRCGFDIVPYTGRYFPSKRRIETMRATDVTTVVDVGANEGQFVHEIRRDGWAGPVVSIEPLPAAYSALTDKASRDHLWTTINVAAGAARGVATLNIADNQVSSSLLAMDERHHAAAPGSRFIESIDVVVETIDSLAAEHHFAGRFYLKIDTQGYELEVLEGAALTINACAAIEVELSLEQLYEGQTLMPEIVRWLLDHGFNATALWPSFVRSDGVPLQMDGIFVRTRG